MTQPPFALPPWPMGERYVVSYLAGGHTRATRHAAGCGVLRLARAIRAFDRFQSEHGLPARNAGYAVQDVRVLEEARYDRLIARGHMPPYTDHLCVRGSEAATRSFRDARPGGST